MLGFGLHGLAGAAMNRDMVFIYSVIRFRSNDPVSYTIVSFERKFICATMLQMPCYRSQQVNPCNALQIAKQWTVYKNFYKIKTTLEFLKFRPIKKKTFEFGHIPNFIAIPK